MTASPRKRIALKTTSTEAAQSARIAKGRLKAGSTVKKKAATDAELKQAFTDLVSDRKAKWVWFDDD